MLKPCSSRRAMSAHDIPEWSTSSFFVSASSCRIPGNWMLGKGVHVVMDGNRRGEGSRGGKPLPIETCPAVLRLPQSNHHPYVSEQVLATSCRALLLSTQVMNTG